MRLADYLIVLAADRGMSLPVFAEAIGATKTAVSAAISRQGSADGFMVDYLEKAMDVLHCTEREREELQAIAAGKTYLKHKEEKRLYTEPVKAEKPRKPMNVYGAKRYENVLKLVKAGKTDAEIMEEWQEMTEDVLAVYRKIAEGRLTQISPRDGHPGTNGQLGRARVGGDDLDEFETLYAQIMRGEEQEAKPGETMKEADMRIDAEEAAKWRPKKKKDKPPAITAEEKKRREQKRHAKLYAEHHEEILAAQRARYAAKHAEKIKAREEYRMSDKEYTVTWNEKDGLKKVHRTMTVKARTALDAVNKFKAAYMSARTGKSCHNVAARLTDKSKGANENA